MKMAQSVLDRFFLPQVRRGVDDMGRRCSTFQKTARVEHNKVVLELLPVIDRPFSKIEMDIMGPLLTMKIGYRYILMVCDYMTCFPKAITLKTADSAALAEASVDFFSMVGPDTTLTYCRTNFQIHLMKDLYSC